MFSFCERCFVWPTFEVSFLLSSFFFFELRTFGGRLKIEVGLDSSKYDNFTPECHPRLFNKNDVQAKAAFCCSMHTISAAFNTNLSTQSSALFTNYAAQKRQS